MANRIVSLMAKLGLDGTGFQQGLAHAGRLVKNFAGNLTTQLAGAFSTVAIASVGRNIAQTVGRIKDLSEQFSATTDEVQRLDAAARMSGQSFESVGVAIERVGNARREAAEGNEELRATFQKFGVTLADLNNPTLRNIDLMHQMATAIRGMNLTAADSQALRDLFGKSGARLAAVFADLEKVKIQPISEHDIEVIDQATKRLEAMRMELTALGASAVNLSLWDFLDVLKPGFMKSAGNPKDNAPAMSSEDVAAANARKHFRDQQLWEAGPEGPMFKDKAAEKKRLDILKEEEKLRDKIFDIQMAGATTAEKHAMLEEKIAEAMAKGEHAKALGFAEQLSKLHAGDKTHSVNLTSAQSQGAFSGLSTERVFAIRNNPMAEDAKKTAQNTVKMVERLTSIDSKVGNRTAGGPSF